jgi:nucleoid-associated protein YgaU
VSSTWDTTIAAAGDALVATVLLLGALLLARTVLVAGLVTLSRVPGSLGRRAAALAALLRPGIARRLVATLLGLGTPALAVVTTAPPASASALPASPGSAPIARPAALRTSSLPDVWSAQTPTTQRSAPVVVVVRSGDTLWDIARRHLPASATSSDVARAWPRWYAANRAAIGPDPALLRPGTRLRSPDRRPAGTPASTHDRPPATRTEPGAVARSLDPDRR